MNSISLPYFADPKTLPYPIPTAEEIQKCTDVMFELGGRKVVEIGPYVVKFGPQIDLLEGENMIFVAQATSVNVPRVYALFKDPSGEVGYIVMERIAGRSLESQWLELNEEKKAAIVTKLRKVFQELRKLPSPGGYCSLGKRPLLDYLFWTSDSREKTSGPFATQAELNSALVRKYRFNNGSPNKANFYSRNLPSIFRNHPPVFTHGDFQRKNIILRTAGSTAEDVDLVLLDFEFAGWYPSYWEYARALHACGRWEDDWWLRIDEIMAPEAYQRE